MRVDSHLYSGYTVPPNYDSLIGKVITWGEDRERALLRMRMALDEIVVDGIRTNIPLHQQLVRDLHHRHRAGALQQLHQAVAVRGVEMLDDDDGVAGLRRELSDKLLERF